MKQYEYTYTIKSVDVTNGHILVEYLPTDALLTKFTLNLYVAQKNEDGSQKTFEQLISEYAPHERWEAQELLTTNYDILLNKTDTVVPNA